jgi:hypothetical protein
MLLPNAAKAEPNRLWDGEEPLWAWNLQIIADFAGQKIVYLAMSRNRRRSPRLSVYLHGVVAALQKQLAAMLRDMPGEIGAFQAVGRINVSRMTSAPASDCSDNSRFASKTMATASSRFVRALRSSPLVYSHRQFFDERDVAFRHLHVYSRQSHLPHPRQSYQGLGGGSLG